MEVAVAGVLDAGGRLNGEEARAFQGEVERVAGLPQRALRKIGARRAENSKGTDGAGGDVAEAVIIWVLKLTRSPRNPLVLALARLLAARSSSWVRARSPVLAA